MRKVAKRRPFSFAQERAAPLYEAAAKGGSAYALAVLGYRFATGAEGTTESCPAATAYYEPAAVKAVQMLDGLRLATAEAHAVRPCRDPESTGREWLEQWR